MCGRGVGVNFSSLAYHRKFTNIVSIDRSFRRVFEYSHCSHGASHHIMAGNVGEHRDSQERSASSRKRALHAPEFRSVSGYWKKGLFPPVNYVRQRRRLRRSYSKDDDEQHSDDVNSSRHTAVACGVAGVVANARSVAASGGGGADAAGGANAATTGGANSAGVGGAGVGVAGGVGGDGLDIGAAQSMPWGTGIASYDD